MRLGSELPQQLTTSTTNTAATGLGYESEFRCPQAVGIPQLPNVAIAANQISAGVRSQLQEVCWLHLLHPKYVMTVELPPCRSPTPSKHCLRSRLARRKFQQKQQSVGLPFRRSVQLRRLAERRSLRHRNKWMYRGLQCGPAK